MTLAEWIAAEDAKSSRGAGEMSRLSRETGIAYSTIHRWVRMKDPDVDVSIKAARLLSQATGGVVSIAELRLPRDELIRIGIATRRKRAA